MKLIVSGLAGIGGVAPVERPGRGLKLLKLDLLPRLLQSPRSKGRGAD